MSVTSVCNRHAFRRYLGINTLVLGAAGFIGRWVSRRLCDQSANVFLAVREREASEKVFSQYGIDGKIFRLDLNDSSAVRNLFKTIKPAIVFNLAGYGVDHSERDEQTAYRCNADLVETICMALAEYRDESWSGQALIHVGSALEYGDIDGSLAEESVPRPTTFYGKSKLAGTNALSRCCQQLNIPGMTVRLFSIYGAGEHRGRLLPSIFEAAVNQQSLPMTSGSQERDFTYVGDAADGLLRLGLVGSAKPGEVVNLASGRLTSVRRFAEVAAATLQMPREKLLFGALPTRPEEMKHSPVTIDRLRQLTSWRPPTTLEDGIRQTLLFQNKILLEFEPTT